MKDPRPTPIYRKDYRPPHYWIDTVDLQVRLHEDHAEVEATLELRRNPDDTGAAPLTLHGEKLDLRGVWLDGEALPAAAYRVDEHTLTIHEVTDTHVVLDANHPLAGKDLTFAVELVAIG